MGLGMRNALFAGCAGLAMTVAAGQALAGGFALREQGARGQGASFAGAAAGGSGLNSMFWNPAIITQYPGHTGSWTINGILPSAKLTPNGGILPLVGGSRATGDIGLDALTAASASAYQFNQNVWLGINVSAPFGLATKNPYNWAGQIYGRSSKVFSTEVTPTVAIKINDMISVGFGLRAMYFKTRLTRATGTALNAPTADLEGSDWAFGFTAGVTFTPFAGTDIGIGYRSQMEPNLKGNIRINAGATTVSTTPISGKVKLPDQITLGLRQRITDRFTLLAGYEWTNWSVLGTFPVTIRSGPGAGLTATTLAFKYRDGWYASLGGEYAFDDRLTLRAGVAYEKSPVTKAIRTVRLPDADRIWLSAGATYKWSEKLSFDLGYTYITPKNGDISYRAGHHDLASPLATLDLKTKADVHIISAGLTYRWDDPAVVKTDLPLVRKY